MKARLPISISLLATQDAKDCIVLEGVVGGLGPPGSFLIWLGSGSFTGDPDLSPARREQSINGSLQNCFKLLMSERIRSAKPGPWFARGHWSEAGAANIVLDSASPDDDQVQIAIQGNFATPGSTAFFTETFDQLLNRLTEIELEPQ